MTNSNHYTPRFKSCMFLVLSSKDAKIKKLILGLLLNKHTIFLNHKGRFYYTEFSSTFHDNNIIRINDQCDIFFKEINNDDSEGWEFFTVEQIIK